MVSTPAPSGGTPLAAVQEDAELASPVPQRPAATQAAPAPETDDDEPTSATSSASEGKGKAKGRRRQRKGRRIARKEANKAEA